MGIRNMIQSDNCLSIEDFAHRHGIQPAILQAHILVGLVKGGMNMPPIIGNIVGGV